MLRKTFICVAGVIAGVSAGAYSSGFFNQDNVVTTAYNQVAHRIGLDDQDDGSSTKNFLGGADNALVSAGLESSPTGIGTNSSSGGAVAVAAGSDSSDMTLAQELLAANGISPSSGSRQRDSEGGAARAEDMAEDVSAIALKEEARKNAQLKQQQAQLNRRRVELSRRQAAAKKMEQDRMNTDKARAQVELEQAQALVERRFTKEVYKSSNGEQLNYRKLAPKQMVKDKLYPLVVFLHGVGERGDDNKAQLKHGLKLLAADGGMKRFPAIVVAPQCPADQFWSTTLEQKDTTPKMDPQPTPPMRLVIELLDSMLLTEAIDPDRVYVTGLSMGGFGTFDLITRRPTLFAAAAPVCGGGDPSPTKLRRLLDMPMWIVHGTDDEVININRSREMVYALESAGASPRYSELEGFGHNIWDATYSDIELYNWMFSQSKNGATMKRKVAQAKPPTPSRPSKKVAPRPATPRPATPRASNQTRPQVQTSNRVNAGASEVNARANPLLGQWKVLAASQKGRQAPKQVLEKMSVTFEGDQFIIEVDGRREIAKFNLSGSRTTQQIDIISNRDGGTKSAGIFEINGERMIICWGEPGRPRPTRFVNFANVRSLILQKQ